ncbi:hypothetical protein L208DRAFT_1041734, partial [Tricholoma matsutake]
QVLMLDELKVEERPHFDNDSNQIISPCHEHSKNTAMEYNTALEYNSEKEAIGNNEVHLTTEATVGALGVLSGETCIYSAHPILISGSCKWETGIEHAALINTAYQAGHKTNLRTICITSDGESQRGEALVHLTFKCELAPTSLIYDMLHVLPLMNTKVGDDDLTTDKDYKHVFKQLRNLLLHDKGLTISTHGVHLKPAVICSHLCKNDVTSACIDYLLNLNDWQDIKLAY